jgi:hypothetical protein
MASMSEKGFSALDLVLTVCLLGAIAVGGYFAYQNSHTAATVPAASITPVAKQISPTPNAMADWQLITNPNGTWTSIQAPKAWVSIVCDGGSYIGLAADKSSIGACNSGAVSSLGLTYAATQQNVSLVMKEADDASFKDEMVTMNGVAGHKYTKVKQAGSGVQYSGYTYITYTVSTHGKVFTGSYRRSATDQDVSLTVDEIIQTWKI